MNNNLNYSKSYNYNSGYSYNSNDGKPTNYGALIGIGLLFFCIGIILMVISVISIKDYKEKDSKYIETNSVVVDYDYKRDDNSYADEDNYDSAAIIVEYNVDGTTYKKRSNVYTNIPKRKGSNVKIKYNPSNPSDIIWENDSTNIILPILSIIFMIVGIITTMTNIINKKKNKNNININNQIN